MTQNNPQVPWTDEQWARVNQVIQDEAARARVAATFLPLYGPLPPDTDFVRADVLGYSAQDGSPRMRIEDVATIPLPTLQVKVFLRGAQMADPQLSSALQMFRRAANILARLEDAVVFNGQSGAGAGPANATAAGLPAQPIWEIFGGSKSDGLFLQAPGPQPLRKPAKPVEADGNALVSALSGAIGELEGSGHFGPFAVVLGQELFTAVQTPE